MVHAYAEDVTDRRRLEERLRQARPDLKVLYMSGYVDGALVRQGRLDAATALLQKPFSPDALERKVRQVLDDPG
jgi:CheY-like chemotaxis protein